jgi:hypothetical protein
VGVLTRVRKGLPRLAITAPMVNWNSETVTITVMPKAKPALPKA